MKPSASPAAPFNNQRPSGMRRARESAAGCSCAIAVISVQHVLMEFAALHNGSEILALLLEQAKVLQRIAIDDDQIGEGAGLQRAELAFLPHDTRANGRRLPDDLDWRENFGAQQEFTALL